VQRVIVTGSSWYATSRAIRVVAIRTISSKSPAGSSSQPQLKNMVPNSGFLIRDIQSDPGDADLNRRVEFADFVVLADHFGQPGHWSDGDFDGNGQVDFSDFVLLADNFNFGAEPARAIP
jgi:hypothetical protein